MYLMGPGSEKDGSSFHIVTKWSGAVNLIIPNQFRVWMFQGVYDMSLYKEECDKVRECEEKKDA